jgi:hypothetical protein
VCGRGSAAKNMLRGTASSAVHPRSRDNRYFIQRYREDDTVISDSNSKVALPLARERFDITTAGFSLSGQRVEDSNSDFGRWHATQPVRTPAK